MLGAFVHDASADADRRGFNGPRHHRTADPSPRSSRSITPGRPVASSRSQTPGAATSRIPSSASQRSPSLPRSAIRSPPGTAGVSAPPVPSIGAHYPHQRSPSAGATLSSSSRNRGPASPQAALPMGHERFLRVLEKKQARDAGGDVDAQRSKFATAVAAFRHRLQQDLGGRMFGSMGEQRVMNDHGGSGGGGGAGMDERITVFARKRPQDRQEMDSGMVDVVTVVGAEAIGDATSASLRHGKIMVHELAGRRRTNSSASSPVMSTLTFRFDDAFDSGCSSIELYLSSVEPRMSALLNHGAAVTVVAYGTTGSGKTYTMFGADDGTEQGITELALATLFHRLGSNQLADSVQVAVAVFEIYQDRIQDLLQSRARCTLLSDPRAGRARVAGLRQVIVTSAQHAWDMIQEGLLLRASVAADVYVEPSSRSHLIVQVQIRDIRTGTPHGLLTLVDLAGSERAADGGTVVAAGAAVNKSLLALKECIRALNRQQAIDVASAVDAILDDPNNAAESSTVQTIHVPWRASKLTLVLRDALSAANASTVIIACVNPNAVSTDQTLNTLRYAARMKTIRVIRVEPDTTTATSDQLVWTRERYENEGVYGDFYDDDDDMDGVEEEEDAMIVGDTDMPLSSSASTTTAPATATATTTAGAVDGELREQIDRDIARALVMPATAADRRIDHLVETLRRSQKWMLEEMRNEEHRDRALLASMGTISGDADRERVRKVVLELEVGCRRRRGAVETFERACQEIWARMEDGEAAARLAVEGVLSRAPQQIIGSRAADSPTTTVESTDVVSDDTSEEQRGRQRRPLPRATAGGSHTAARSRSRSTGRGLTSRPGAAVPSEPIPRWR